MQTQQIKWLVEYSRLDAEARSREYFSSREAADAFVDDLSSNHVAMIYPVDEDGRPIVEEASNFNV